MDALREAYGKALLAQRALELLDEMAECNDVDDGVRALNELRDMLTREAWPLRGGGSA